LGTSDQGEKKTNTKTLKNDLKGRSRKGGKPIINVKKQGKGNGLWFCSILTEKKKGKKKKTKAGSWLEKKKKNRGPGHAKGGG